MAAFKLSSILVLALSSALVSSDVQHCVGGYCFVAPDPGIYEDFDGATKWCKSRNSPLVSVTDRSTQVALTQFMVMPSMSSVGSVFVNINLRQLQKTTWFLVNGSQYWGGIVNQNVYQYKVFTCLAINASNSFVVNASGPTDLRYYICQYEHPSCSVVYRTAYYANGLCYVKYENETLTWYQARERCWNSGGDLAMFNYASSNIYNFAPNLDTTWLTHSLTYWVGIRWNAWSWNYPDCYELDGTETIYTNWSNGRPSNYSFECICVDPKGDPTWSWTDCDCYEQRQFVCIKPPQGNSTTTWTPTTDTSATSASVAFENRVLIVGVVLGVAFFLSLLLNIVTVILCIRYRRRIKTPPPPVPSRPTDSSTTTEYANSSEVDAGNPSTHYEHLRKATRPGARPTNSYVMPTINGDETRS